MSFVYCQRCDWGQDDFWSESYNPIQCILESIDMWGKVDEWVGFDSVHAKEIGAISRTKMVDTKPKCREHRMFCSRGCDIDSDEPCMVEQTEVLSLSILLYEIKRTMLKVFNMWWPTYEDWKNDPNRFECPFCGGTISVD